MTTKTDNDDDTTRLRNVREAARAAGVCVETVYRGIRAGRIEAVKVGRVVRLTGRGYRRLIGCDDAA